MSRTSRVTVALLLAVLGLLVEAPAALAHQLGNFTVNAATEMRVHPTAVLVEVVLDSAEIPTLQAFPGPRSGAQVPVDAALPLELRSTRLSFPPGEAGLATTRLVCVIVTAEKVEPAGHELVLAAAVAVERIG